MRGIALGAIGLATALLATLAACSSSIDNGLEDIPSVHITESERATLTAGAVGATGITVTDASSGASVEIPAGTVIALDASSSDDVAPVIPASIVVVLRPISQYLAAQNGDLLPVDDPTITDVQKVGALAILPVTGRTDAVFAVTIPVASTATGTLSIWRFVPDDNPNTDGVLTALPTVGHWRFIANTTAADGKVTFDTDSFGQYLVTTLADTGGGGTAPTVELTADPAAGDKPLDVEFTADATDDGTITKYEWDFDGDGTFDTETTAGTVTHTYETDGQFEAEVQVTDDDGETGSDTITITVGNAPPAITVLDPLVATTGVAQAFTVTAEDSDGTIAKYEWDLDNDGTFELDTQTTPSTTTTFDTAGTETIGVRVTDNEGGQDTATFDITVSDAAGPTAELTADPPIGVLSDANELVVEFTTVLNPAATEGTVVYDFGDGSAPVTETDTPLTAEHTYTAADTYTATVTVTPTGGGADIVDTFDVTVLPTGTIQASITPDPEEGTLSGGELDVTFTTGIIPDTTGVDSVLFDFGDGDTDTIADGLPPTVSHTYTAADTYTVTMTITPAGGGDDVVATTTVIVNVESGGNQAPTAAFTATPVAGDTRSFTLDATSSTDPESDALTFEWEWDSTNSAPESTSATAVVNFPASADGIEQTITLTVTDTADNSDTEQKTVTPTAPAT